MIKWLSLFKRFNHLKGGKGDKMVLLLKMALQDKMVQLVKVGQWVKMRGPTG